MKHVSEVKVSRRQFIVICGVLGGAADFILQWLGNRNVRLPTEVFVRLHNASDKPDEVAATFVRAKSPTLMASYAVFFPQFLDRWGQSGLSLITDSASIEKSRYSLDHHRLDALPAVVAAHLLPTTLNPARKEELCQVISRTLLDPNREVRETVVQNLITAVSPDFDSVRFFSIDHNVLASFDELIEEAKASAKLLSPLCLCTEFLLNARASLVARGAAPRALRPIEKRLRAIARSKVPHFEYAARLVHLHQKLFPQAAPHDPYSLPPQRSEALLGWRTLPSNFRPYLEHLALIHARTAFTILHTATGEDAAALEIMTSTEAQRALPKALSFLKHLDIRFLLPPPSEVPHLELPVGEHTFRKFLQMDLDELLTHPERYGINFSSFKPGEEEYGLAHCVPFSQYKHRATLSRLALDNNISRRDFFWRLISAGRSVLSGMASGMAGNALYELFTKTYEPTRTTFRPTGKDSETLVERALETEKQQSQCLGPAMDEQEAELGPALLPYIDASAPESD